MLNTALEWLSQPSNLILLKEINRGVEKEGLRVNPDASLAQSSHPIALGSALTHKAITTDYSESQLEFITPVFTDTAALIRDLSDLHVFTAHKLKQEQIWPGSMPCYLHDEAEIPIAEYGDSDQGRTKHLYRKGLAHRYGRRMQTISGLHYNLSLPEEIWQHWPGYSGDKQTQSEAYFALIRNCQRHAWLLCYLFGASPMADKSFFSAQDSLHTISDTVSDITSKDDSVSMNSSDYGDHVTSLRMSDCGYQSDQQQQIKVRYSSLQHYCQDMQQVLEQPHPLLTQTRDPVSGEHLQLNNRWLQQESEHYAWIRPKPSQHTGKGLLADLQYFGVGYIELRLLDLNPFHPLGFTEQQLHFIDLFLLYCLLAESPVISQQEEQEIRCRQQTVALEGRKPGLKITFQNSDKTLVTAGTELLNQLQPLAKLLDSLYSDQRYIKSLQQQKKKLLYPQLTPSGWIVLAAKQSGFIKLMQELAQQHHHYFIKQAISDARWQQLEVMTTTSLSEQIKLEQKLKHSSNYF